MRVLRACVCVLALWAVPAQAQPSILTSCQDTSGGGLDDCSLNATGASLIVAAVSTDIATPTSSSCTFNSVAFSQAPGNAISTGTGQSLQIIYLNNPSQSTFVIACAAGPNSIVAWAIAGADTVTPLDSVVRNEQAAGTTVTCPALTSAVGDLALGAIAMNGPASNSPGGGFTTTQKITSAGDALLGASAAGAASLTMTFTQDLNVRATCMEINVNAASAAATCNGGMMTLGAGTSCEF